MASRGTTRVEAWGALLGEILAILPGLWFISRGWTEFGWMLVAIGAVGFAVSSVHLVRVLHRVAAESEVP